MTSETSNWFSKTGWSKNPFALEIRPELFVGCAGIISELESGMSAGQKYAVVLGPTGAGKTTLLKKLAMQSPCFYLPKPPATKDELLSVFSQIYFGTGIARKLFGPRDVSLYNFSENANKKYKGNPPILLIDEANESDIDVLEWFRALIDQIEGQSAIFAGLPSFKSTHLDKLETLSQRVTISINMNSLTKDEIFELMDRTSEAMWVRLVDQPVEIQPIPITPKATRRPKVREKPSAKPLYKRWWFWGILGAGIAGGVAYTAMSQGKEEEKGTLMITIQFP